MKIRLNVELELRGGSYPHELRVTGDREETATLPSTMEREAVAVITGRLITKLLKEEKR